MVEPIWEQSAGIFYNKLFEYDPNLRALFKGDLKAQGRELMAALRIAMNGTSDLDQPIPVLQELAARHVDYGVKPQDSPAVGNALLFTLKNRTKPELHIRIASSLG